MNYTKRNFALSPEILVVFVAAMVAVSSIARAAERPPVTIYYQDRVETAADAGAALLDRARRRGQVRVIVGLRNVDVAPSPDASRPDASSPDARSSAVEALPSAADFARLRSAQNALLDDLVAPSTAAAPTPEITSKGAPPAAAPAVRAVTRFDTIGFVALSANDTVVRRLLDHPQVASVQEDVPVPPALAQSAPLVGATQSAASGFDGTGQVVAVIDTGVAKGHPMLAGKVVSEACYSTTAWGSASLCPQGAAASTAVNSGVNCATSITACSHGTHVASIAVGKSQTLNGIAPGAKLIPIKVYSRFSSPADCYPETAPCLLAYWSDIIQGLERVYQLRSTYSIAAVNLSLGGGSSPTACGSKLPAITAVINHLRAARIATVTAAGNGYANGQVSEPGCIGTAVTVGSTTKGDTVSSFSNLSWLVDLMAPGTNIRAAIPGGGYAVMSGTSMATPHVAGAWALMRQAKPAATVTEVQSALACTGKPVTRAGITKPRIRLIEALDVLRSPATGCS